MGLGLQSKMFRCFLWTWMMSCGMAVDTFAQARARIDTLFSCSDKIMATEERNAAGKLHGQKIAYYRNGHPSSIEVYSNDVLHGMAVYFYDGGDTSLTMHYKYGVWHGWVTAYYKNQRKMFQLPYAGGKLHGEGLFYDTSGRMFNGVFKEYFYRLGDELVIKTFCEEGKADGEVSIYSDSDCRLLQTVPHKKGLPNGRALVYPKEGKPWASIYEFGKYVKEDDSLYAHNVEVYTQCLATDSANGHFYFLRAMAQLRLGEKQKAVLDLNKVIRYQPSFYKAYYNRGVLMGEDAPKLAMEDFKKCIALKPDFYTAQHNLAYLYFLQKDYKNAIYNFKAVLKRKPDHLPALQHLALVYEILKDKKQADYYWKKALEVEMTE